VKIITFHAPAGTVQRRAPSLTNAVMSRRCLVAAAIATAPIEVPCGTAWVNSLGPTTSAAILGGVRERGEHQRQSGDEGFTEVSLVHAHALSQWRRLNVEWDNCEQVLRRWNQSTHFSLPRKERKQSSRANDASSRVSRA
jgi:hypothetical protein